MESYSRTRWLDKLRPAGAPHKWMGRGARWHLSWPLADTTAQRKLTTFLDSCMSSLRLSMLFSSVSFKRETPRIMFVILTQGPCSPVLVLTWRSSYADTVGEGVKKTGKSSGQCTVKIPVQSTAREFHTSLPSRRTSPLVNNFLNLQFTPRNCTHKRRKRRVISGAMLLKKKTQYVLFLYMPKRRPKSRSCHRKPLCTRAVLISVSFKSDEHQYSSSRASATDEPNATLRRVPSLQMTPIHSHSI